ncbi:TonB-dependent receptor [Rhodanobacter sp. AS-Z3]|uniref:TonB-dependent receptor n=1 Tax=Rhodanobacter sp. AS-Z3 TaxID=3031330 RepID=UPI002479F7C7|nr:carboxypeptidase regulatory-like domain-containing protein [Rhodanobacter sp. AS-Z3]WEN16798.1 TonB-dependent receptor [Rhodanobacter sp. AS-Z3]
MSSHNKNRNPGWRRTALALALSMSLGGVAMAQSTTGSIFGQAPAAAGETVVATNTSGLSREVAVDSAGRFQISNVPVGTYTVSLKKNGAVVDSKNVSLAPGAGSNVTFNAETTSLSAVTVQANALPSIDVSSVNSSTVITAADLQRLPIGRNAESIALLAPGTVKGSSYFGNAVAFGGSSVSENAYYVNGYNTGEPYKNLGGFSLPYGAIDQQETLTGGYNAKYGRSDGGVINQLGKRGTNEWHFGGQVVWSPRFLESSPVNNRYGNPAIPADLANPNSLNGVTHYELEDPSKPGTLNQYRNDNKRWDTTYSAYLGGPLIKDKLFLFLAAETTKSQVTNVESAASQKVQYLSDTHTKFYGKLDWNINDSNILELTALNNRESDGAGSTYVFNNSTLKSGAFSNPNDVTKDNAQFYLGHFTSYITDSATLSILYGKAHFQDPTIYGNKSPLPFISRPYNQNPAYLPPGTGPNGIVNAQGNTTWVSPKATNATHGLRVDFDYRLGDHDFAVGIDNMNYAAAHQGPDQQNPFNPAVNYYWRYYPTYVQKRTVGWATSMTATQKAYYLQDDWQVSSNVLLSIGVRNDHFTNYNDVGKAFVDEKNQWEPRIGASWDVNGDSSFKIYGNVGRYYLALPDNAAERAANRSTYLTEKFNYSGIDANGVPTGLVSQGPATSPDGEYGLPKDAKEVTARNLKPEYVDEFIAGFDKKLNDNWTYGAKASWRDLKTAIDDECSPDRIATKMTGMGLDPNDYSDSIYGPASCRLINPGLTNDMLISKNGGGNSVIVPMTQQDWGFINGVRRKIGSMNLYLEHPFDGKWMGRVDYTFSRGFGNTEGQVRSDFGQGDVSKTEDWDAWQLMDGQDGDLSNVRKHQIRFRGAYQITPEWLVSGTLLAQSGTPKECLGYYGAYGVGDPAGYNAGGSGNYHYCHGVRFTPGSAGHTPWTEQLNLGVHYAPAFADHKLGFNLDVINALNQQRAVQTDAAGESAYNLGPNAKPVPLPDVVNINNSYGDGIFWQPPRTVRISVQYDY